ncbi:hypothetical protein [Leptospira levettii]|uniref:hypothetical protein n=1 Tax=Leptospira levettii TaxID=2023178 RepID=UPI000C2B0578|nr:hypothetical protein [Leptospira levettii]PJZ87603.1 hypothetical protein CH368_15955 [Leptospira levettii]
MESTFGGMLNEESEDYGYHYLSQRLYPTLPKEQLPPWGVLIHPDEIRKIFAMGNGKFITTTGDQLTDFQLKNWIDMTVQSFQEELQWDIYPRLWRHRPLGTDVRIIEPFAEWDDPYDYKYTESQNFLLATRRKPIIQLHKWDLFYPWTGQRMLDLRSRAIIKHKAGILQSVFVRTPWSNVAPVETGIMAWRGMAGAGNVPGAYLVDYSTGYDHASRVPSELKEQIIKLFLISVMSSFGDGIIGGMANYSVSTGVISESIGTTMSATSSFYGARILQLTNEIKDWYKRNKNKYSHINFGVL